MEESLQRCAPAVPILRSRNDCYLQDLAGSSIGIEKPGSVFLCGDLLAEQVSRD